ncbi:MAG: hypothetical protein P857_116 [Candidatus Xenolissoclinum pacificiensis L6]|uniref:Uncharacterized protein n=1 Tax=Candidatus Xenolissoclinum pacificiensis L6 TaxID=1401685 RepID=W2UY49_9RICK|nr:MAG: hypothetical protein P857_116 [Candidatus Xenolissoclinum pacificiensis L6]
MSNYVLDTDIKRIFGCKLSNISGYEFSTVIKEILEDQYKRSMIGCFLES